MSEDAIPTNTDFDFTKVKVKQEKPSPPPKKQKDADEILSEILPISSLFDSPQRTISEYNENDEEKKPVEPVKSSNEILAELFKVFNAAPPESLLSDEYLLKKKKKHKNKEKKRKKKSKKRGRSSSDEEKSDNSQKSKKKHKKKKKRKKSKKRDESSNREEKSEKKHKVKEEKVSPKQSDESELTLSEEGELLDYPEPVIDTSIVKKEKDQHSTKKSTNKIVIKNLKDSRVLKEAEKAHKKLSKAEAKDDKKDESSDITLSDEEEYLREKEMYIRSNDYYDRKSRYRGRSNTSRGRYESSRDRFRSSWRSRSRSRHRRRTRSRSPDLVIDKKRLLEIARKNAITMFKSGSLPGTQGMSQEVKDKVVMKMRYGGKTVEELTEFCKKLSKGESLNDLSSLSSNEDSDHDKHGNQKVFYHPFVLKDRGPIVMNIKNATPIPPKTAEQNKAILMQYPVSSGQMHRMTESEWVPVSPKKPEPTPVPPPKRK